MSELTSFADLKDDHPAKQYIIKRLIPKQYFDKLFLCNKFYEWAHKIAPRKYNKSKYDHPRLVIPFYDEQGKVFAYQGRALEKKRQSMLPLNLMRTNKRFMDLKE